MTHGKEGKMMNTIHASAVMITKNAERYLAQVLTALKVFEEVILLDNGSTDKTLEIAQSFINVRIFKHEFIGFGPLKNLAAEKASHDWIFSIDSDEIPDATLLEAIAKMVKEDATNVVGEVHRLNHFRGRLIAACGWAQDVLPRLYRKSAIRFNNRQVHEGLQIPETTIRQRLAGVLNHYSYEDAVGLIHKMQHYSTLFALEHQGKKSSSVTKAIIHGCSAFVKNYLLKGGIRYGGDGFVIAAANAQGAYYKYLKLRDFNTDIKTALIITTYNRPDALVLVIRSALTQTRLPNEILIADDGSDEKTQVVINQLQQESIIPIKHIWQTDNGFRLAESRNRAIAAAESDYIVMIDGDMVLDKYFIADHLSVALRGRIIQGSRVLLSEETTQAVLSGAVPAAFNCYSKGLKKRYAAIRLAWLRGLISAYGKQKYKGIKGCNLSFYRDDVLAVNGFNQDFVGWGREDSEFFARCYHSGFKRHDLKFGGVAYHLYHHEADRSALVNNDPLFAETLATSTMY